MNQNDRRFQVFISSTFEDLKEERKQAIEVVVDCGHMPVALERFSAANESDLAVIRRVIADCQIYLLILGHRYGELVPDRNISFTELEYEIAEENGLLILPLVLKREEINSRRAELLDPGKKKDDEELKNYEKLLMFHDRIKRFRQYWGPEDQFKFFVLKALTNNLEKCEKPGFVREPEQKIAEIAVASENEFIYDIAVELKSFESLYGRCLEQADLKAEMGRCFREHYLDRIIKHKVNLFFESGSTLAYVAKELSEKLSNVVKIKDGGKPNIQISTNNVLAYLQLWLKARVPCTLFPWSPPHKDPYGACFGALERLEARHPDYKLPALDELARQEIDRLHETLFSLGKIGSPQLLLADASGLQINDNHRIRFKDTLDEETREEVESEIRQCLGPHVGSYHNKVFKRYMYETGIPIMIFITADKIDSPIEAGKCHFILDSKFTWDSFYRSHPVAFCVGCDLGKNKSLRDSFRALGFDVLATSTGRLLSSFIARNEAFINQFDKKISA